MVDGDTIQELFPDSPIPTTTLTELESHDDILTAIPIMTEEQGPQELSNRVLVQTDAVAIVAVYDEDAGWELAHSVDGSDRANDEVFQAAMVEAQGDTPLVESPENQ